MEVRNGPSKASVEEAAALFKANAASDTFDRKPVPYATTFLGKRVKWVTEPLPVLGAELHDPKRCTPLYRDHVGRLTTAKLGEPVGLIDIRIPGNPRLCMVGLIE